MDNSLPRIFKSSLCSYLDQSLCFGVSAFQWLSVEVDTLGTLKMILCVSECLLSLVQTPLEDLPDLVSPADSLPSEPPDNV